VRRGRLGTVLANNLVRAASASALIDRDFIETTTCNARCFDEKDMPTTCQGRGRGPQARHQFGVALSWSSPTSTYQCRGAVKDADVILDGTDNFESLSRHAVKLSSRGSAPDRQPRPDDDIIRPDAVPALQKPEAPRLAGGDLRDRRRPRPVVTIIASLQAAEA
jgi:hypothetical protein